MWLLQGIIWSEARQTRYSILYWFGRAPFIWSSDHKREMFMSNVKEDHMVAERNSRIKHSVTTLNIVEGIKAAVAPPRLCLAFLGFFAVSAASQASTLSINNNVITIYIRDNIRGEIKQKPDYEHNFFVIWPRRMLFTKKESASCKLFNIIKALLR